MNYVKSLLTVGALVAVSGMAMAFPSYTVNPAAGTLDNVTYLESINISGLGSFTVEDGAVATLVDLENGDDVYSTAFKNFMGTLLIKFDSSEITHNGEYELEIPPGVITVSGETNPKITVAYTLNDANLVTSGFPQIELLSSNPASGSEVAAIGEDWLNKVSFTTTNDDAVNYIEFSIYDVTNVDATNPDDKGEYVYSGNENRRDTNRNNTDEDIWTDGLYVTIGGPAQYLLEGHTYKMNLTFAGIGYDPATNQYPSPTQIANSTELTTYIEFVGKTPAQEYSPYTYESVSPDPATYEIDTAAEARFTITYSGPVKPSSFEYSLGGGSGTLNAGTFEALGDPDENGYSNMWEFEISESVVAATVGTINLTVITKDADGLFVKGNGGYAMNDTRYTLTFECNVGAPDVTLVSPVLNAEVESLSEIIVGNTDDGPMAFSNNATEPARILTRSGELVRTLGEPEEVVGNSSQMKWTFEEITEEGYYVVMIPKWYFAIGEEMSGSSSKATSFGIMVTGNGGEEPGEVTYDLLPESVSPANGSTISELSEIVLTFSNITLFPDWVSPSGYLYRVEANEDVEIMELVGNEDNWFAPKVYTFGMEEPITQNGVYKFVIGKGAFNDEAYQENEGKSGKMSPELVYTWTVDATGNGVEGITVENETLNVYTVAGVQVLKNAAAAEYNNLPAGLYIVNGKKVVKK